MKHFIWDKMSENELNRLFVMKSGELQEYKYRDDLKLLSNLSKVDIYQNNLDLIKGQLETLRVYISERFGPYTDYDSMREDISEGIEQLDAEDDDSTPIKIEITPQMCGDYGIYKDSNGNHL